MADSDREARMQARLTRIYEKVQWMAEQESRSAWVQGDAAQGAFLKEKEHLLEEAENIIDRLIQAGGTDAQRS